MTGESEILALRARIAELEYRLEFVYKHLRIEYPADPEMANRQVVDMLKRGNKIEAVKLYREIYNVGLAEAKQAVYGIESRLGF